VVEIKGGGGKAGACRTVSNIPRSNEEEEEIPKAGARWGRHPSGKGENIRIGASVALIVAQYFYGGRAQGGCQPEKKEAEPWQEEVGQGGMD